MVPGRKTDVRDSGGAPRHPRGEVRASRARRCTAARNSGQPAIGPRREDAIERDHRRGRRWPASPNSRGEIERLRSVLWRLTTYAAGGAAR